MTTQTSTGKRIRVFLVDDHPLFLEALGQLLCADRHIQIVGQAYTAEEALERTAATTVDLVVMDIRLPGMDGLEATRILKKRPLAPRVMIVSSFGEPYLAHSIEAGADGYLLKTSAPTGLVEGVLQAARGAWPMDPSLTRGLLARVVQAKGSEPGQTLSDRHREELRLLAGGFSSKEVAARLEISQATLKRDFKVILSLLGVNDRTHAVAEAYRRGLLSAAGETA